MMRLSLWILLAFLALQGIATAGDERYMRRFLTNWTGGGEVRMSLTGSPWHVYCHFQPTGSDSEVTLSGRCRLRLIFFLSKSIVAKLKYDESSGSYSGTYVVDD